MSISAYFITSASLSIISLNTKCIQYIGVLVQSSSLLLYSCELHVLCQFFPSYKHNLQMACPGRSNLWWTSYVPRDPPPRKPGVSGRGTPGIDDRHVLNCTYTSSNDYRVHYIKLIMVEIGPIGFKRLFRSCQSLFTDGNDNKIV